MTASDEVEVDPDGPYQLIRTDFRGEKSYPGRECKTFGEATKIADRRNEGRPENSDRYYVRDKNGTWVH